MKKINLCWLALGLTVGLTAFGLAGCSRNPNQAVQAAPETNTAEPVGTSNVIEGADKEFILQAEKDNLQGRYVGRLAQERSQNEGVKAYGKMLADDDETALRDVVALMQRYGVPEPKGLPEEKKEALDELKGLSGQDFDKKFIKLMVEDHEKALADFQRESKSALNDDVRSYAEKQIPMLQKHLNKAKELQTTKNNGSASQ
jgi:putative membrane protein